MTNPDKKITVGMLDILDAEVGSITLHHVTNEDDEKVYHAIINLLFPDGTDEGIWLTLDTTVNSKCRVCAAIDASKIISGLSQGSVPNVLVFDENANLIEEFDMFDPPPHLDAYLGENQIDKRVLH